MRVGFTGSREGMTADQMLAFWNDLEDTRPTEFHHGDCIGADSEAHEIVDAWGDVEMHGHIPLVDRYRAFHEFDVTYSPRGYVERNHDIVDATEVLVAAPKGPEELRSGTWSTVRYALTLGREVRLILPDGAVQIILPPPT